MSAIKVFMGCGWDKELVFIAQFFLKNQTRILLQVNFVNVHVLFFALWG
jgi:hypothetical protein